jgi:uridine kinase
LSESLLFNFDDYEESNHYPNDFYQWYRRGSDITEFDFPLLYEDVMAEVNKGTEMIILDYPFGREHPKFSDIIDLHIFIDTPLDIALSRKLMRDENEICNQLEMYELQARPLLLDYQIKHREVCDLILDGSCAVKENVQKSLSTISSMSPHLLTK